MPQSPMSESRRIGIAVDLNEESTRAIKWAVSNYIRPEDTVILLHVQPTDVLFGADWGDLIKSVDPLSVRQQDIFSTLASSNLVGPLREGKIPYKLHVVKDFDRKERICLEAERLKLSVLIMGDRRKSKKKRSGIGSVSKYCTHHCECPVLVVWDQGDDANVGRLENEAAALYLDSKI